MRLQQNTQPIPNLRCALLIRGCFTVRHTRRHPGLSRIFARWEIAASHWTLCSARTRSERGSRRLTREQIRAVYERITPSTRRAILRLYRAAGPEVFVPWQDAFDELTRQVPTVVVWGTEDPYIPARFAERWNAREVHRLEGCGHWPPSEAPREVAAVLRSFLDA